MFSTRCLTDSLFTLSYPEDFVNNFFIVFCLSFYDCLPFLAVSLFILSSEHIIVNMFFNFFTLFFTLLTRKVKFHSSVEFDLAKKDIAEPFRIQRYLSQYGF